MLGFQTFSLSGLLCAIGVPFSGVARRESMCARENCPQSGCLLVPTCTHHHPRFSFSSVMIDHCHLGFLRRFVLLKHAHECVLWWCDQNVKGAAAPHRGTKFGLKLREIWPYFGHIFGMFWAHLRIYLAGRSASGVAREEDLARTESKAVLAQYDAHVEQVRFIPILIQF